MQLFAPPRTTLEQAAQRHILQGNGFADGDLRFRASRTKRHARRVRSPGFRDEEQVSRLRKLWESLEMEIVSVIEATNRLRESAEFELHALVEKKPEMFESVVAKQVASLETEIANLKGEAEQLEDEIKASTGQPLG